MYTYESRGEAFLEPASLPLSVPLEMSTGRSSNRAALILRQVETLPETKLASAYVHTHASMSLPTQSYLLAESAHRS